MRITNSMTSNRVLLNIHRNKNTLDTYYQQLASGKKIQYASENPIIASRALKFRTTVEETKQYQRNATQGISFLEISEIAVKNVGDMLERVRVLSVQGASGSYNDDDRAHIALEVQGLIEEIGLQMNQTYAGRNVFSGARTDEPAVFNQANNKEFTISQDFNYLNIESFTAHHKTVLDEAAKLIEASRIKLPYKRIEEDSMDLSMKISVTQEDDSDSYKLGGSFGAELAKIAEAGGTYSINGIDYPVAVAATVADATDPDTIYYVADDDNFVLPDAIVGSIQDGKLEVKMLGQQMLSDALGPLELKVNETLEADNTTTTRYQLDDVSTKELLARDQSIVTVANETDLKAAIAADPDLIYYNEATNEFYFPSDVTDTITATGTITFEPTLVDVTITHMNSTDLGAYEPRAGEMFYLEDTGELILSSSIKAKMDEAGMNGFSFDYEKKGFESNELNPKVYFTCFETDKPERVYKMDSHQNLQFEFGANIRINVNTLAKDIYTAEMHADFAEFSKLVQSINGNGMSREHDLREKYAKPPYEYVGPELDKAVTDQMTEERKAGRSVLQDRFQDLIGSIDKYANNISKQRTDIGTRMSRIDMIGNRLADDFVAYSSLLSDNEDADYMEVISGLQSMETIYRAAMSVATKLIQTSLVDFI